MHHTKYPKDRSCLNTQAGNLGPLTNEGETEAGLCAPGCTAGLESTDRAGITGSNLTQVYLPTTPGVRPPLLCTPHTLAGWPGGTVNTVLSFCLRGASQSRSPRPAPLCLYAEGSMRLWKPLLSLERGAQPPPHHASLLTPPSRTWRIWVYGTHTPTPH